MPRFPRYEPVYAAFSAFLQRCLVEDGSLLWPGREIWTITNLEHMRRRFAEGFIQGRLSFRQKLEAQLSGAPPEVWALAADSFYIYGLPSSTMRFSTKKGWVTWAAQQAGLPLPGETDPLWEPLRLGFAATGQKYNLKHAQLRLLTLLALEVKAAPDRRALLDTPERLQELLDGILAEIPLRLDRANDMRSAILYMAFPESYEPILSSQDKDAILRHYRSQVAGRLPADRDSALRQVRETLAPRFPDRPFDFFQDLREEWRPSTTDIEQRIAEQVQQARAIHERTGETWRVQAETEPDPDVRRVLSALRLAKNVILYGPPGTGKTYLAQKAALRLVDPQAYAASSTIWWVTLHPSYAYEDFVEGLRPVLVARDGQQGGAGEGRPEPGGAPESEGGVAYEVRPGVFREICARAARDPDRLYVLVMDEINRGNLARVLGELMTLIEDDKRGVLSVRLPYSGDQLTVPPNLVLLGTMNTADRSIALLDAALRRRFAFVEIPPRPELLAGAVVETDEAVLRLDELLSCLNAAITRHLDRDHQIGHSYFLRVAQSAPEERVAVLELVWNHQILPLLVEFFFHRKDHLVEILAPFIDESTGPEVDLPAYAAPDPAVFARLSGEDLVVALSRLCESRGGD